MVKSVSARHRLKDLMKDIGAYDDYGQRESNLESKSPRSKHGRLLNMNDTHGYYDCEQGSEDDG